MTAHAQIASWFPAGRQECLEPGLHLPRLVTSAPSNREVMEKGDTGKGVASVSQTCVETTQTRPPNVRDCTAFSQYTLQLVLGPSLAFSFIMHTFPITAVMNEDISFISAVYQRLHCTQTTTCSAFFTQTHVPTRRGLYSAPVNCSNDN